MAKSNNSPRRSSEPRIAEALKPVSRSIPLDKLLADHALGAVTTPPRPPVKNLPPEPARFAKLSLSIAADLARSLRITAVVEHNVSESGLVEVALRRFLALPATERTRALVGIGRRRKK
jgi:hypothetical protein